MADTPKLVMPEISVSQSQKETSHNEALRILDALVQLNVKDKDLTAPPGGPVDGDSYIVNGVATGAWAGHEDDIAYYQSSAWIFLQPTEGWLAYVQDENALYVYTSGSDPWVILTLVSGGNSYDIGGSFIGAPTASQVILRVPCVRTVDFDDDFAGSQAKAGTAATAQTVFDIQKNGVSVGSMTFAAAATTATFTTPSGLAPQFLAGDVLTVVAPASPDATLANVGFLFKGSKG